jgi:hypothetical protein
VDAMESKLSSYDYQGKQADTLCSNVKVLQRKIAMKIQGNKLEAFISVGLNYPPLISAEIMPERN